MIEISEQFRGEDQRREAFTRCCLACSRNSDIKLKNSQQHQEFTELSSFEAKILYPTFRESINEKEALFSNILCSSCEERFKSKQSQVKVLKELLRFYDHPNEEEGNIIEQSPKDQRLQIKDLVFLVMHTLNEVKGAQYQQEIMENNIQQLKQEQQKYPMIVQDIQKSCKSSNSNLKENQDNYNKREGNKLKGDRELQSQQQQVIQKIEKQTQQFQNKLLLQNSQQQQQSEYKLVNEQQQQLLKTNLPPYKHSTPKLQCSPCNSKSTSQEKIQNSRIIQDQNAIQQLEGSSLLADQIDQKIKQYTIRPKSSVDKEGSLCQINKNQQMQKQPAEREGKDADNQRGQQTGGSSKLRRRRQSLEDSNSSKTMNKYIENRRYSVAKQSTQIVEEIIHQRENNIIAGEIVENHMKDKYKTENSLDNGLISRIRTESLKNAYSMYLENSMLKTKGTQEKRITVHSRETPTGQDAKKKKKVIVKLTNGGQVEQRACITSNSFNRQGTQEDCVEGVDFGGQMNHGKLEKQGLKNIQDQVRLESQINKHKERSNSVNIIQDSEYQSKKAYDFRDQSLRQKRLQDNLRLLMTENNKETQEIFTNCNQTIQNNGCQSNLTQGDENDTVQYLETADIQLIREDSQASLGEQQSSCEERPASKLNESEFLSRERYLPHYQQQHQSLGFAKYHKEIRSRTLESSQDEDIYHINRSNNSMFSTTQDRCYTTATNSSSKQLAQQIRGRVIPSSLNCSLMRSLRVSTSPTEKDTEINKKPGMIKPTPQQEISIIKNAIQQGDLVNGCFVQNNARLNEGVFLVSAQWWRQWRQYVGLSSQPYTNVIALPGRNSTPSALSDSHPIFSSLRPSTILNKQLLAQPITGKPYKLKDHLLQHYHYEAIPKKFFQYLSEWYGVDYEIKRYYKVDPSQGTSQQSSNLFLDIYPEKQQAYQLPCGSRKKNNSKNETNQSEGSTKSNNPSNTKSSCNNSSNKQKNKDDEQIQTTQDTPEQKIKSKQPQQKALHASIDLSHIDCLIQSSSPHNENCVFGGKTSTAENKSSLCIIF